MKKKKTKAAAAERNKLKGVNTEHTQKSFINQYFTKIKLKKKKYFKLKINSLLHPEIHTT